MTPGEGVTKFRQDIDEPDQTFVSDADVEVYLDDGYREFRNIVCDTNPQIYNASEPITLAGVRSFDLVTGTPSFLGASPTATAGRLVRINEFNRVSTSGDVVERFSGVSTPRSVDVTGSSYALVGTSLLFSRKLTGTYSMEYVPEGDITWLGGGASAYIDDLVAFHDLIPLLAYRQYAIVDGAQSAPILQQTSDRLRQFSEYLQARASNGCDYVDHVAWYNG